MRSGARPDFISHARINVFRGMVIAGILLVISQIAFLQTLLYRDWIIVSMILYACALPFVWRRAR